MEKKYIIWIIFGALFLLALALVSSQAVPYEAPNYTNVSLILNDYVADIYTNVTLILGELEAYVPSVTLRSPINNANLTSTSVTFNCSASDDIQLVDVTLYGNWTGTWSANETNSSGINADYIFTKTINDSVGNIWNCYACDNGSLCSWGASNWTFNIDTIDPTLTIIYPTNNSYISSSSLNITGTASDTSPGTVIINDTRFGTNQGTYTNWNFSNSSLDDGFYSVKITADDTSGNSKSDVLLFTIDNTNPVAILNSPIDNFNSNFSSVTFNCSGYDNLSLKNITLYGNWTGSWLANETNTSGINNTDYIFTKTIPDGLGHIWNCLACDNGSNCAFATANRTFNIDTIIPNCTLVSISPSDLEQNSTGNFEAIINCTDININASSFLITRTIEGFAHLGLPNYWSIRPPENNEAQNATCGVHDIPQILKADGRWDDKWYDFAGIFSDNYSYAVNDNSSIRVTITEGTGWALLNYTWNVEPTIFRSSLPLSRGMLEKEDKTDQEYNIYRDNYLLVKFWDLEAIRNETEYTIRSFRNINYTDAPNFDLTFYYCNNSYDLIGAIAPNDDTDNCVFANSLDMADLDTIYYSSRNSSYSMSYYLVNESKFGGVTATDTFYIFYRSLVPIGKSYNYRYANGSSGTNVSFADSNVAWTSTDAGVTWIQANFTPDAWFAALKTGDEFNLGVYIKDTFGNNYTNFTFVHDDIGDVNHPISSPNIEYIASSVTGRDYDINETHNGNLSIRVNIAIDPDDKGIVNHSLYLANIDGTINYTINSSFYSDDDSDLNITFDTTSVVDGDYKLNITAIADDLIDIQSLLTTNNFTIDNTNPSISYNPTTTNVGVYVQDWIFVNITCSDIHKDTILFNWDGTNETFNDSSGDIYWENKTDLAGGNYTFYAWCNDSVGNENQTAVREIKLDIIPPFITIYSPLNQTYNYSTIDLNWSTNEPLDWAGYSLNDAANVSLTLYENTSITGQEGSNTLIVYGNDTTGNMNSTTVIFGIDTIAPSINITYPLNITYNLNVTTLNWSISDFALDSCWYGYNNVNTTVNCLLNYANISLAEGGHTIYLYANDTVGHENSANVTFIIDVTFPVITWEDPTPEDGIGITEDYVYLNTTITDATETSAFFDWNKSILGYWSFDYYNSTGLYDNSSYNNFGTFNGGIGISNITNGKRGKALEFDGVNDYINFGNILNFERTDTFSIGLWYKSPGTESGTLVSKLDSGAGTPGWHTQLDGSNKITFILSNTWGVNWIVVKADTLMNDSIWHHIMFTYDGSSNKVGTKIYVDGISDENYALTAPGTLSASILNSKNMQIGAYDGANSPLEGTFDEVVIFNRNLSAEEAGAAYNIGIYRLENNFTSLSEGDYNYSAYAIDSAGNLNITLDRQVTVDQTYPLINYTTGTEEDYANVSRDWIFVNVSVIETNEENITFRLFNSTDEVNITTYTTAIRTINWTSLSDEDYTYNVTVCDIVNQCNSTAIRHITLDTTVPTLTIIYPTNNSFISTTVINITGTASDLHPDTIVINDTRFGTNQGTYTNWNFSNSSITDGIYSINITANDTFGNSILKTLNFTIDSTNPSISYNPTTTSEGNYSRDWIFVNITCSDTNKDSVIFNWNGTNETFDDSDNDIYWENKSSLTDGIYTFYAWCNDSASNENQTFIRTIELDTIEPLIDYGIGTEINNTFLDRNYIIVNITASDLHLKNITTYLYNSTDLINETSLVSSPLYLNFTSLSDGIYYFNATAYDTFNNSNSTSTRNVTIDTIYPQINITYPINGTSYTVNVSELNYTYVELYPDKCWYGNGTSNSTPQTCTNFTNVVSMEGYNTWTIYMNDSAGNENSSSVTFLKDTLPPSIDYTTGTEANNSYVNQSHVYVNVTWVEARFKNITYSLYNTSLVNSTTYTTEIHEINWTGLIDGEYTYNVTIYDIADNTNSTETRKITLDTILPKVQFVNPTTEADLYDQLWIYANVTASDLHLDTIVIYLYNSTGLINSTSNSSSPLYINFTGLTLDRAYYLNATANDTLGHINYTETRTIQLFTVYDMNITLTTNDFIWNATNTTGIFEPINQTNTTGILLVDNIEVLILNVTIKLNETYPWSLGNITVYANDEYNYSTAEIVNTSTLKVIECLAVNDTNYIWMWANYTDPRHTWFPEIEILGSAL